MEARPGAVIGGKLRLIRPLGQGGMGVVWAARHLTLETDVAVKLIRPERAAADPATIARFEREARATARIAHPHVVKVMDYGTAFGASPYLVMELLRGFSLAELLERGGRFSLATARSLAQQVGSALESAHEQGIVHRDIKPQNVFITEGSRGYPLFVKVLDFGVAKMLGGAEVPEASPALTETGVVIGSAPYMSPEQLEGRKDVDLRSDLWSLGVIVYECLTGVRPFEGGTIVTVGAAVLRGKYRPASELRPNLPGSVDHWFAKALCVDPEGRFRSAREMVAAFLAEAIPASEPEPEPEPAAVSPFATTVTAHAFEAGSTAAHAPLAPHPDPVPVPAPVPDSERRRERERERERVRERDAATPLRPRRIALVAGAAALSALAAVGLAMRARPATHAGCPDGMVLVRGATFTMGSAVADETPTDETPLHPVAVQAFCLDRTEVTVGAYAACTRCTHPPPTVDYEGLTPNGRSFDNQFCNRPPPEGPADHPMNCVDWFQAKAYCSARGERLPTEAEWELAARGTEGRLYPWGNASPSGQRLNACGPECSQMLTERRKAVGKGLWPAMYQDDDAAPATAPVGHYPAGATPAGVMDLAGNVWEWTESAYCRYDEADCGDSRRVLRGGGWDATERQDVRAARRYPSAPAARGRSIGFRCAAGFE